MDTGLCLLSVSMTFRAYGNPRFMWDVFILGNTCTINELNPRSCTKNFLGSIQLLLRRPLFFK